MENPTHKIRGVKMTTPSTPNDRPVTDFSISAKPRRNLSQSKPLCRSAALGVRWTQTTQDDVTPTGAIWSIPARLEQSEKEIIGKIRAHPFLTR